MVPDASLLFEAEFERVGQDLYLHNVGAPDLRVEDYFLQDQPADLSAPNGAVLRGAVVERLAGPIAPGQYAQAGQDEKTGPIGQVETVSGGASVQRADGTVEVLQTGSKIQQNDVLLTDDAGKLSVTFVDGTIFTLAPNSRMVVDELIYDPASNANSGGFSLVQGGFVFIAGQVAKTGGMVVDTPSATMGIRGTTVRVEIQTHQGMVTSQVSLARDPDGSIGEIVLRDLQGNVIANVTETSSKWVIHGSEAREQPRTVEDDAGDSLILADAVAAYQSALSRVEAGQTFVEFGNNSGAFDDNSGPAPNGSGQNLDSIDEPNLIEPGDTDGSGGDGDDDRTFDEGRLRIEKDLQAIDVQVTGKEDAGVNGGGGITGEIASVGKGNLTYALQGGPAHGIARVDETGSFVYIPDQNFNGGDSFTFAVTNVQGDVDIGTVSVRVQPVNDAPELLDSSIQDAEDSRMIAVLQGTDIDNDSLTYSIETSPLNGLLSLQANGTLAYTPDPDFVGSDSFQVRVDDGAGGHDIATISVTVTGVNDAPRITTPVGANTGGVVDGSATTTALGTLTATDVDAAAALTWSGSTAGTYGDFVMNADGNWVYTLGNGSAAALSLGETIAEQFTATVTDEHGATASQTVRVLVTGTNDAAVIGGATSGTLAEDSASVSGDLSHTDVDAGNAADLFRAVGAAAGSVEGYGTYTVTAAGVWTFVLNNAHPDVDALSPGDSMTDRFSVFAEDGTEQVVTVTIQGSNDAPQVVSGPSDAKGAVTEGSETTSTSGRVAVSDPDNGATVTWTGTAAGVLGAFTMAADGGWTYVLDNSAAESLSEGETATETFVATATDDHGATVAQSVVITVTGTNDAPVVARETVIEVAPGDSVSGAFTATDADSTGALIFALGTVTPDNGTVLLAADGGYTYTPDSGFQGLDRFEYTVTDAEGGVSTARATVEVVKASGTGGDGQSVSVAINAAATPDGPAGSVLVTAQPIDATSVNLVFALDRSGSIGSSGWAEQTEAVASALEVLAAKFSGSATSVDVKIITYGSDVTSLDVADLQDPTLPDAIRSIRFTGGGTNWTTALAETETFFDSEPANEANFLFFVTDGDPTSGGWQDALTNLTDAAANGYSVNIEAFGIGGSINFSNLELIDPTPTTLSAPSDLVKALTETPAFNPDLASFELSLEVDGTDLGVIAGLDSPALIVDGLNYSLAIAEIDGLADLLGRSNRFSVHVGFDLDGDSGTTEIELFTTEVFERSDTAQSLAGLDQSDLLLGSAHADDIAGGGGNDLILGFGGNDVIAPGAGVDIVLAGRGNDRLVLDDLPAATERLDGGLGRDVLDVDIAGDIGSDLLPMLSITGVEAIDMQNGLINQLDLSIADLLDLSDTADTELETLLNTALPDSATIYGDAGDTLTLTNGVDGVFQQTAGGPVDDGSGNSLAIYEYVAGGSILGVIGIDDDIAVTIAPVTA